ncbi:MAG: response regulator [Acidobacteria bacterium]|nr:response regulator [Acidobacteriota bacterium]
MPSESASTVLVVDDDEPIRDYLSAVLSFEGYRTECFGVSAEALEYLGRPDQPADLLLTDIRMPGMGGLELLSSAKRTRPNLPVVLISGLYELALAIEALEYGADDYLKKPVRPADVLTTVGKYLQHDTRQEEAAIQRALEQYLANRSDPLASEPIRTIFRSLGFRRYETFQHSKRVAALCRHFGVHCGLSEETLNRVELGALLHDIGKIGIPRNILLKPGPLTEDEWRVMRSHPSIGRRLMEPFAELHEEAAVVYGHHERWDGLGYPQGLIAEQIPLAARMFAIVDTFDAITSDRPYRPAQSIHTAKALIAQESDRQFDPQLVDIFLRIPDWDLDEIRRRHPDHAGDGSTPE